MYIKFWGVRGSVPVSGPEYTHFGGDTPCLEVRNASNDLIIVDCGSGLRRLGNSLLQSGISRIHLFLTHTHWDHIIGFPFLKLLHDEKIEILLYGYPRWQGNVRELLFDVFKAPHFPVRAQDLKADINYIQCRDEVQISGMRISPVPLSHPNLGVGFSFREQDKKFVFLTDNELDFRHRGGLEFSGYADFCKKADLLVHDAEFTVEDYSMTRTWGHSRATDAIALAAKAGVARLGLFHHNQDRQDSDIFKMEREARDELRTLNPKVECFAVAQDQELVI
ncbi:MAG: MBL fold metallo-hydrolase [Thermodesulfobacteriota bacterium]